AWSPTSSSPRPPAATRSRRSGNPPRSSPKTRNPSCPSTVVTRSLSGAASSTPGRPRTRATREFGSRERVKSTTPLWKSPKSARPTWIRSFAVRRTPAASERSATISPTPIATPAAVSALRAGRRSRFRRTKWPRVTSGSSRAGHGLRRKRPVPSCCERARRGPRGVRTRQVRPVGGAGGEVLRDAEVHHRADRRSRLLDRAQPARGDLPLGPVSVHPPQPRVLDPGGLCGPAHPARRDAPGRPGQGPLGQGGAPARDAGQAGRGPREVAQGRDRPAPAAPPGEHRADEAGQGLDGAGRDAYPRDPQAPLVPPAQLVGSEDTRASTGRFRRTRRPSLRILMAAPQAVPWSGYAHRVEPRREDVLGALERVIDPELGRPVTELDMVRDVRIEGADVFVTIALTVAGCPLRSSFENQVRDTVGGLPGVGSVSLAFDVMSPEERQALTTKLRGGVTERTKGISLDASTRVLAVASGKGGVGKSTLTANLAAAFARSGQRTGILDADVYGHSIPHILGIQQKPVLVDKMIVPPVKHGLKLMSIGFFLDDNQQVMWRGPMLHRALEQFLSDVHWGQLDVLVVDMPPGTGDVAISLGQLLPRAETIVVTTPQPAAQEVAARAGVMAQKTGMRLVGVIENMTGEIFGFG